MQWFQEELIFSLLSVVTCHYYFLKMTISGTGLLANAMNRFSAATMVNITADSPPSYKAALLNVLQQGAASSGGPIIEWSPDGQKSG